MKVGPGCFKVKFTPAEDLHLREVVENYSTKDWSVVASHMIGRNARQCRERWNNYINPTLTNLPWTAAEDALLDDKFADIGRKWKELATYFPQRSQNQIKNHWALRQKKLPSTTNDQPGEDDVVLVPSESTIMFDFVLDDHDRDYSFWDDLGLNPVSET
jgi:hypothetical protein